MLPATKPDIETKATEAQVLQALASLAGLPSKQADDEGIDRQMYFVALEGVTRYALNEAVKSCSRGGHGHGFFPNTAELRRECDRAMEPHYRQAEKARQQEHRRRENAEYERTLAARSPQAMARARQVYADFCRSYEDGSANAESEEIRERYGMTEERMAKVPDAGIGPWKKPKVA